VSLSDESYGALLLKIQAFYETLHGDYTIETSHIVSDRFAKKAYYFAVLKKGQRSD
jgi:ribonuclease HIII